MKGIILCGEQGAGKSTVANLLVARNHAKRISFADPLREEAADIVLDVIGWPKTSLNHQIIIKQMVDPVTKHHYRDLLRWLGPYRRSLDPNTWTLEWYYEVSQTTYSDARMIVTDDARYNNERNEATQLGFKVLLVRRAGLDRTQDTHESETDWRQWDYDATIVNDADIETLYQQTISVLEELDVL